MWEAPPAMCSLLWQDSNIMSLHAFYEQDLLLMWISALYFPLPYREMLLRGVNKS